MAVNILLRKSRYASRSDREREKLQSQIETYAIRHRADQDLRSRVEHLQRIEDLSKVQPVTRMDSFIDWCFALVSGVLSIILISVLFAVGAAAQTGELKPVDRATGLKTDTFRVK